MVKEEHMQMLTFLLQAAMQLDTGVQYFTDYNMQFLKILDTSLYLPVLPADQLKNNDKY